MFRAGNGYSLHAPACHDKISSSVKVNDKKIPRLQLNRNNVCEKKRKIKEFDKYTLSITINELY